MLLYPAIDLRGGRCVRLYQGDFERETVYGTDPVAVTKEFAAAGAEWIHVVDLDAARRQGTNRDIVTAMASAVDVPVQTGGGIIDDELLRRGIARIVVGSLAVTEPARASGMIRSNAGRVAIGLDHRDGELRVHGWEAGSGVHILDAIAWPEFAGAAAFVVTDIARDATLAGPDVEGLRAAARATSIPVIASGGVASLDDLRALRDIGVHGAIVGKALYEGRFTVEEAIAACAQSG